MVPEGWDIVQLGDVAEESKKRFLPTEEDSRPYVGLEHIDTGSPQIFRVGISSDVSSSKTVFQSGDILFGKLRPYLRKVAFAEYEGVCSTDILAIRGKNRIDARYLHAVLSSERAIAHSIDTSAGTKMPRTSWQSMSEYSFLLPPLPEQKKIAAILSSVDEAIASTQAVIDQTRKVKQGLLQQLLTRGIGHTKFKESAIGEIPKGWDVAELREVSFIVRGSTPRPAKDPRYFYGDYIPWITVSEISKDEWPYLIQTESFLTEEGKKQSRLIPKGTVILKNSGYGLGVPKILALDGCANDGIAAFLELDSNLEPRFLYYFLYSMTKEFRRAIARGVDQPNLNTELIGGVKIPIPPLKEQEKVVEALFSCDELIRETENTATRYLDLKRGLMQDLLTGRVRVKDTSSV